MFVFVAALRDPLYNQTLRGSNCYVIPCPVQSKKCGRFGTNVFHQVAEVVFPAFDLAVATDQMPESVWWKFPPLPLALETMAVLFPTTTMRPCQGRKIRGPMWAAKAQSYFPRAGTRAARRARHLVRKNCSTRLSAARVLLERRNERWSRHCGVVKRGLAPRLVDELGMVDRRVAGKGPLCAQVDNFAASTVISVHGAHLVNALYMAPRSSLVEVRPFGSTHLNQYEKLVLPLRDVTYSYLRGAPPFLPSEDCSTNRTCREIARDCYFVDKVL